MSWDGSRLALTGGRYVHLMDVSVPAAPRARGYCKLNPAQSSDKVAIVGEHVFVTSDYGLHAHQKGLVMGV